MTGTTSQGALAVRGDQQDWNEMQRAALAQIGVAEAPRGDQLVLLHVSQRMGLDPFNKEIYMIGRWDPAAQKKKWTIQVGIDGFRSKSEEHSQYAGVGDAEWCGPDGQWTDVWVGDDPPTAARFTVYRKDQPKPTRSVALYKEYVQKNAQGKPTQRWATAPADQLAKCAEAKARRTAFPRQLGGVYATEELEHLHNPQPAPVIVESERVPDPATEPNWDALIEAAETAVSRTELKKVWDLARGVRRNDTALLERIAAAGERINTAADAQAAAAPAEQTQFSRMFALLDDGGVNGADREARHRIVNRILTIEKRSPAEPITSFNQLSIADAEAINGFLQDHKKTGDLIHTCAELGAETEEAAPPETANE
jgi:phage recombination protein Bet